jgi:hypothetical protein
MEKKIAEEVKALRDEMYNKCIEGMKLFMKERGVQKNCFIETLSFDVSDSEIHLSEYSTIDEITYIPSKDILGFVVYKFDNPNEVFMAKEFRRGDVDLVYRIFNIVYRFYC